ncbi:MAG TPA: hypothetical protein VL356_09670 [Acidocella sp.]|nr:hypothetical protein [Acidocella sp.]
MLALAGRFTYRSIETMIFRQTGRRFAQAFGPPLPKPPRRDRKEA